MINNRAYISPFARLLAAFSIGYALQQVVMIGLSLARVTIAQGYAITSLALGVLLGVLVWRWLRPATPEAGHDDARWQRWLFYGLSVLLGLVYLLLWYVAYLSPDLTCDGTAYHIPAISLWANKGYIYWIDPNFQLETLVNGYPKSVELLGFVLIRATGLSELANALNLIYLPFGVLGLASLARSLGASRPVALFSGMLWLLIPVTLYQSATAYIDSAYGSLAVGYLALIVAAQQALLRQARIPWRLVLPLGALGGLTLAAKGSAALLVGAGFLALLFAAAVQRIAVRPAARGMIWRVLGSLVAAGAVMLLVGGFWYVRNYAITGTPLYPVGVTVGGKELFPGITVSQALWEEGNTPAFMKAWGALERIAFTWTQTQIHPLPAAPRWPVSMMGVDSRYGGLGYLWLLGCLPAILYGLVSALASARAHPERLSLWLVAAIIIAAFLASPMNWWARYTVWLYGLGLPAFALALSDLLAARHWWLAPLYLWVLGCLTITFYEGGLALAGTLHDAYPGRWPPRALSAWRAAAWHWPEGYLFPETRGTALDRVMASGGPIAVGAMWGNAPGGRLQHNLYGQLSLPIGQRELIFLPENMTVALYNTLKARRPQHIIWDGNRELPAWVRNLAERVDKAPGFWVVTVKSFS